MTTPPLLIIGARVTFYEQGGRHYPVHTGTMFSLRVTRSPRLLQALFYFPLDWAPLGKPIETAQIIPVFAKNWREVVVGRPFTILEAGVKVGDGEVLERHERPGIPTP